MSLIDTTYAEPKLYLSARRDRGDKSDLETLFLENLGTAEGVRSYARWASGRRRPERPSSLGAPAGKEQHMTPELLEIHEQSQSPLDTPQHWEENAASWRGPWTTWVCSAYGSQAKPPDPRTRQLICDIQEAYEDLGVAKRNARSEGPAPSQELPAGIGGRFLAPSSYGAPWHSFEARESLPLSLSEEVRL